MRSLRGRLIGIALALVLQQAAGLAAVAALACCDDGPRAASAMPCCSKGDAAHICPLGQRRANGAARCRLTAGCSTPDERGFAAALFMLSSPAPAAMTPVEPLFVATSMATWEASPIERTLSPPAHPPQF
jgi:hypothetical protein